ncbi:class I SAM-dependent methyltransferase [Halonotius terrestris]|uniref:Class I SAM-dependent methyltransferase n=1 Tax=Halonotius terrestris TaxID=2487750 RepID=A0A8J8P5H2_9EURY|nr:class I SAM-dependent methyltransferase [Halonotius terrestris]TQQ78581.1 class I SAM-dependent methyltransferase [Halonotius terrestris]
MGRGRVARLCRTVQRAPVCRRDASGSAGGRQRDQAGGATARPMSQQHQRSERTAPPVDILHLGCGDDTIPAAWNVDKRATDATDEVWDLSERPWPWPDGSFDMVVANHVVEHLDDIHAALCECARVLAPGGELTVRVPVGNNARADPDHSWGGGQPWTWRTPTMHCGARPWDRDCGLEVTDRDVELHSHAPAAAAAAQRLKWWVYRRLGGPGEWCFEQPGSGEFTVRFQKPEP